MPPSSQNKSQKSHQTKNHRYADILAAVDSGASLSRYLRKLDEHNENFKIKKDEIFRRMKLTTYVHLVMQVAKLRTVSRQGEDMPIAIPSDNASGNSDDIMCGNSQTPKRHALESVIKGIGECDLNSLEQTRSSTLKKPYDCDECPYLLLDVRDRTDFDQCHIIKAVSYPHTMLSRISFEIRKMLVFRNKPGHIIVCYDADESLAPHVATVLTQRGYDNVFVLSGGLKLAWKLFPKGLILGAAPSIIKYKPGQRPRNEKNIIRLSSSSSAHCLTKVDDVSSVAGESVVGDVGSTSSVRRAIRFTFDTYEPVGSRGTPNEDEEFSMIDLAHLSLAIENLSTKDRGPTSRISTAGSVCSRFSTASGL